MELSKVQHDERGYYSGWNVEKLIDHILMLNEAYHQVVEQNQRYRIRLRIQ